MIKFGELENPQNRKKPSNKENPLFTHAIFIDDGPIVDCSHLIFDDIPQINGVWSSDDEDDSPGESSNINNVTFHTVPFQYDVKNTSYKNNLLPDDPVNVIVSPPIKRETKAFVTTTTIPQLEVLPIPTVAQVTTTTNNTVAQEATQKTRPTMWELLKNSKAHQASMFEAL